ncbi:MAG TPA: SurA N-terminal domain-containing protein, partial [Rhizomicrobium sp.]|nr:SurA N-terminal domain-containing protein [Rhizomicrobium sp.]
MRKYTKSWVSSLFLGALALAFVFWGVGDIFRAATDTTVASVGGNKIPVEEYQREYSNAVRVRGEQTGQTITQEMARAMGIGKQVLESMVSRAAIDNIVANLGLTASDAAVSAQVHNMDAFKGPLGTFDHQAFERAIAQGGFSEPQFIAAVRADTARDQLMKAMESGFQMPAGYIAALFASQNEVRGADYIFVPEQAAGAVPAPTDAQLAAYVKAHAPSFSSPEYREVTYAGIGPDDVSAQIKITDDQLKQEYEAREATFVIPEKRDIEQIVFPNEADAQAASAKIASGTSFADIATARGFKPNEIKLGALTKADLADARGDAAFALPANGVSKPVKGLFGWVLLHVTTITPGVSKSFDQVKDQLRQDLTKQLAIAKLIDVSNAYQDATSGGASLTEAAKKTNMHASHIAAVDQNGLAPDGSKTAIAGNTELLAQIFKADVGEDGDPFQTRDGHFYVIKVDGVTPQKLKPLDAVRAEATAEWTEQEKQKQLAAKASALAAQVNGGQSLDAVAKSIGATVQKSPALQRESNNDVFSPALLLAIFTKPVGVAVAAPAGKGNSYVVARATGVIHP